MAPELVPASKKPKITIIEILLAAQDSGHALQEPRPVLRESKNGRYDQMGATASGLGTARAPWSGMRDVSSLLRPSIAPPNWLFLSPLPTSLKGEESLMRLCEVCLSTLPVDAFHQSPKNSDCHHEASTCNNCLGEYIQSVSVSTALDAIPCPEVSCNAFLSYYQMKNHAAPDSFQRYDAKLRQDFLASSNDYTKCARPDCLDGGFFDGDDSYIICPCGANTCIACKTIWHPGVTHQENLEAIRVAEEQRERDQQSSLHEIATKKYIKARAKICPKCSSPIVKNKGCDHMTCKSRTGKGKAPVHLREMYSCLLQESCVGMNFATPAWPTLDRFGGKEIISTRLAVNIGFHRVPMWQDVLDIKLETCSVLANRASSR